MGELIGQADNTKDGLISAQKVPFNVPDFVRKYIRIKKKLSLSFFLEYFATGVSSNLYFVSMSEANIQNCTIKKIAILASGNTLSGKQDSQYIYLTKPWGSSIPTSIIPVQGRASIEYEIITELPGGIEDIQIID